MFIFRLENDNYEKILKVFIECLNVRKNANEESIEDDDDFVPEETISLNTAPDMLEQLKHFAFVKDKSIWLDNWLDNSMCFQN